MEINVTVRDKIAQGDGTRIVCGNSDYIVRFDLDAEWEQFITRTMIVVNSDKTYREYVFTGDTVALPVINNQNGISIGLYAGDLHTTTSASFDCIKSARCGLGVHEEPNEDVYNQLVQLVQDGAVKGDKGDNGEPGKDGVDGKDGADGRDGSDAPQIDDATVSGTNPWSSKHIIDALCTPFEASGSVVTCHPVEGYPLGVVSRIDAVQEGTGDPSPDNVRAIAGWDSVQLVRAGYQMIKSIEEISNDKMLAVANEDRTAFTITNLIESTYCMARFNTNADMLIA